MNLNNLSLTFKSEFGKDVRVVGTPEQPFFVAKDIAEMLGYKNTIEAVREHIDKEDKSSLKELSPPGGSDSLPLNIQPHTILINESGLYSLILRSKLPAAKQFKRWVTAEVLPSIRKQGGYSLTSEFITLQREYHSLKTTHERFVKSTRTPATKKKGECVYVFDYAGFRVDTCKIGVTTSVATRARSHRTTIPIGKMIYVVYTPHSNAVEEMIKAKYTKTRMSEVIQDVPVKDVVDFIDRTVRMLDEYEIVTNIEADIEEDDENEEENEAEIESDEHHENITKYCTGCTETLPVESFHRDRKNRDGRRAQCTACRRKAGH